MTFALAVYAGEFDDILDNSVPGAISNPSEEISLVYCDTDDSSPLEGNGVNPQGKNKKILEIENLTLLTPTNSVLIRDLSIEITEKYNLLVSILISTVLQNERVLIVDFLPSFNLKTDNWT